MNTDLTKRPFLFLRCGETVWNAENRIIGQEDIPLSSAGIAQAYKAGRLLTNIPISQIVHSSLLRCMATASIVAAHTKSKTFGHEGLREANMGVFQGRTKSPECSYKAWAKFPPPNAETFCSFQAPIIAALRVILVSEGTTLIVSHGGVFDALQKYLQLPKFYLPLATPVLIYPCQSTNSWQLGVISDPFAERPDVVLASDLAQRTASFFFHQGKKVPSAH